MATIELILTEDIDALGVAGEMVKVKAGYGRNYLLPQGKAMLATAGRVADIEHKRRVIEEQQKKHVSGLQDIARRAGAVALSFEAQASPEGKLFGSVTNMDIAAKLAEAGVEVDRRKLQLAEPIKQVGDHEVALRLHREVIVPLKVTVTASGIVEETEEEDQTLARMDDGSSEVDDCSTIRVGSFVGEDAVPEASEKRAFQGGNALRAIPSDHDAERAVLGAILLDHESLYKVQDKLEPLSFDLPRHRLLYQAYMDLADKNQAITLLTLRSYLTEQQILEDCGGLAYLTDLLDGVPTAANVEAHADLVRETALARALIRTCEDVAKRGYDAAEPVSSLLEHAEREVLQIATGHARSDFSSLSDEMGATFDYIERVQAGDMVGVRTGYDDFDQRTGGLNGGDLVILAARPSMGKTAFALNLARNHVLDNGGCCAFFSLEMTKRELVLRMLLGEAQIDNTRFRNGMLSDRDWPKLTNAASRLQEARLYFDDSMGVTVSDLAAKARRLHREQKLDLLVIDYIQLVQGRQTIDHREQQVADISRSLKLLAKDLDIPVIALSQLNRGPEGRNDKRPMLSDLRESGAIEQDADLVMFIYRDEVYDEETPDAGIAEIILAKQRNGPIGTVKLQFNKQFGRFHDLARRNEGPPPEQGFDPDPESGGGSSWGGKMDSPF